VYVDDHEVLPGSVFRSFGRCRWLSTNTNLDAAALPGLSTRAVRQRRGLHLLQGNGFRKIDEFKPLWRFVNRFASARTL